MQRVGEVNDCYHHFVENWSVEITFLLYPKHRCKAMLESKFTLHPNILLTRPCLGSHQLCGSADNSGRDTLILPLPSYIHTCSTGSWEQGWFGLLGLRQPPHMLSYSPVTLSSQCWSDKFAWVLPIKAYNPVMQDGWAGELQEYQAHCQTLEWLLRKHVGVFLLVLLLFCFIFSVADHMSFLMSSENQSGAKNLTPA